MCESCGPYGSRRPSKGFKGGYCVLICFLWVTLAVRQRAVGKGAWHGGGQ